MSSSELLIALSKNDSNVKKELFENHFEYMSSIALRFSKNKEQAMQLVFESYNNTLQAFVNLKSSETDFTDFLKTHYIKEAVAFIKAIRSEYYVASTVLATRDIDKNYSLFENNDIIDFNTVDKEILSKSLQELVPSQRLVFNLFVIDGFDTQTISDILEASEQAVKSNLEKARYNLQKNIEKNNKASKHEQAL